MDRDSRHLYDIAKLLPEIKITPELDDLIDEVREDRMQSKNNPSAQLEHDIPEMLKEIISSRFYEPDYNNITKKLLYEEVSYEDAIKKGMNSITITFLFLLILCLPLSIMSTDYEDYLDFNMEPPKGSQYWVAPFITDYIKNNIDLIDKSCMEYLKDNVLMKFD